MGDAKFYNLDEARTITLLSLYEKLNDLPFGTDEFLSGAQAIGQLEKVMSETYKADSDYAAKVKAAELDSDIKKELAIIDGDIKKEIAEQESNTKINVAVLDGTIKKELAAEENEIKKELAEEENNSAAADRKKEVFLKTLETGAKVLLVGAQLIVFVDELSKSRMFEQTGIETSSAFKKLWSGFKPFQF